MSDASRMRVSLKNRHYLTSHGLGRNIFCILGHMASSFIGSERTDIDGLIGQGDGLGHEQDDLSVEPDGLPAEPDGLELTHTYLHPATLLQIAQQLRDTQKNIVGR